MTFTPRITREPFTRNNGTVGERVTIHGDARRPQSTGEWTEQAIARLGLAARSPAGRVVAGLLVDGEPAVKDGRALTADQRYAVLQTLDLLQQKASDIYPAARPMVVSLRRAWVGAYGDEAPRLVS